MRPPAARAVPPQTRLWDPGLERCLLRTRRILERQEREADRAARLDDEACLCPGGNPRLGCREHVNRILTCLSRPTMPKCPSIASYSSFWPAPMNTMLLSGRKGTIWSARNAAVAFP